MRSKMTVRHEGLTDAIWDIHGMRGSKTGSVMSVGCEGLTDAIWDLCGMLRTDRRNPGHPWDERD